MMVGSAKDAVHRTTELWLRRLTDRLTRSADSTSPRLETHSAALSHLDEQTVYEWETGAHAPSPFYEAALCAYHRVGSVAELGLGREPEAAAHWTWATKAERRREVERRRLLRLVAAGVGAQVTRVTQMASLLPVGPLTQAAQLLAGRRGLAVSDLDVAEQTATILAAVYTAAPSGEVVSAAAAHARTLERLLTRASLTPAARPRLAAIASDAASLAGYTALDADDVHRANAWFARALTLAREAEDPCLEALALASTVRYLHLPGCREVSGSRMTLQAAASAAGRLPPAARAWIDVYLCRALAYGGDEAGSGRALDDAACAAGMARGDEPGWGWWSAHGQLGGWDGPRLRVFTAVRSLALGRHAEAVSLFEQSLDGVVVAVRRVGLREDLAYAWTGLDEPERACSCALAALDESDAHGLGCFVHPLRQLRDTFPPPWSALECVAELDERLRQTKARTSAHAADS